MAQSVEESRDLAVPHPGTPAPPTGRHVNTTLVGALPPARRRQQAAAAGQ